VFDLHKVQDEADHEHRRYQREQDEQQEQRAELLRFDFMRRHGEMTNG
jgi:hypothetical protein